VSSKFILAKAGRHCRNADAEKKDRYDNARPFRLSRAVRLAPMQMMRCDAATPSAIGISQADPKRLCTASEK
jgi:hypothetical protein